MIEYDPISAKAQSRLHRCGKKVLSGIFFGFVLYAGGIWKRDIVVAGYRRGGKFGRVKKSMLGDSLQRKC